MMRYKIFLYTTLMGIFLLAAPTLAQSNFGGTGSSFSCASTDSEIMQKAGSRVSLNTTTYYAGYYQISGTNKNPVLARFDEGVRTWCRQDYETTTDDGQALGIFWNGSRLIGVFSATGTQSGSNYTRWTGSGWLPNYGTGGGSRVSILLNIDPITGSPINGTYLYSKLSSGKTNSLEVTGVSIQGNSVIVNANSWFSPLNTDKSVMNCTGTSPLQYTIEFSSDFSRAIGAEAQNCTDNSPAPNSEPMPGIVTPMLPISNSSIQSGPIMFQWQATANATRYWVWVADAAGNEEVSLTNLMASNVCINDVCTTTVNSLPFGTYVAYILAGNSTQWSSTSSGYYQWSVGVTFNYGPIVTAMTPTSQTAITSVQDWGVFRWEHNDSFEWYGIYIVKPNNQAPLFNWYSAVADTDGLTCVVGACSLDLHLEVIENGQYQWFVVGWNSTNGTGPWSSGIPFTVSFGAPAIPTGVTVDADTPMPKISWPADSQAAYYQIWVGSADFQRAIYFNWNRSNQLCGPELCSLILDAAPSSGDYVAYVQAWGPGGFNNGSSNEWSQPTSFTIGIPSVIIIPETHTLTATRPDD